MFHLFKVDEILKIATDHSSNNNSQRPKSENEYRRPVKKITLAEYPKEFLNLKHAEESSPKLMYEPEGFFYAHFKVGKDEIFQEDDPFLDQKKAERGLVSKSHLQESSMTFYSANAASNVQMNAPKGNDSPCSILKKHGNFPETTEEMTDENGQTNPRLQSSCLGNVTTTKEKKLRPSKISFAAQAEYMSSTELIGFSKSNQTETIERKEAGIGTNLTEATTTYKCCEDFGKILDVTFGVDYDGHECQRCKRLERIFNSAEPKIIVPKSSMKFVEVVADYDELGEHCKHCKSGKKIPCGNKASPKTFFSPEVVVCDTKKPKCNSTCKKPKCSTTKTTDFSRNLLIAKTSSMTLHPDRQNKSCVTTEKSSPSICVRSPKNIPKSALQKNAKIKVCSTDETIETYPCKSVDDPEEEEEDNEEAYHEGFTVKKCASVECQTPPQPSILETIKKSLIERSLGTSSQKICQPTTCKPKVSCARCSNKCQHCQKASSDISITKSDTSLLEEKPRNTKKTVNVSAPKRPKSTPTVPGSYISKRSFGMRTDYKPASISIQTDIVEKRDTIAGDDKPTTNSTKKKDDYKKEPPKNEKDDDSEESSDDDDDSEEEETEETKTKPSQKEKEQETTDKKKRSRSSDRCYDTCLFNCAKEYILSKLENLRNPTPTPSQNESKQKFICISHNVEEEQQDNEENNEVHYVACPRKCTENKDKTDKRDTHQESNVFPDLLKKRTKIIKEKDKPMIVQPSDGKKEEESTYNTPKSNEDPDLNGSNSVYLSPQSLSPETMTPTTSPDLSPDLSPESSRLKQERASSPIISSRRSRAGNEEFDRKMSFTDSTVSVCCVSRRSMDSSGAVCVCVSQGQDLSLYNENVNVVMCPNDCVKNKKERESRRRSCQPVYLHECPEKPLERICCKNRSAKSSPGPRRSQVDFRECAKREDPRCYPKECYPKECYPVPCPHSKKSCSSCCKKKEKPVERHRTSCYLDSPPRKRSSSCCEPKPCKKRSSCRSISQSSQKKKPKKKSKCCQLLRCCKCHKKKEKNKCCNREMEERRLRDQNRAQPLTTIPHQRNKPKCRSKCSISKEKDCVRVEGSVDYYCSEKTITKSTSRETDRAKIEEVQEKKIIKSRQPKHHKIKEDPRVFGVDPQTKKYQCPPVKCPPERCYSRDTTPSLSCPRSKTKINPECRPERCYSRDTSPKSKPQKKGCTKTYNCKDDLTLSCASSGIKAYQEAIFLHPKEKNATFKGENQCESEATFIKTDDCDIKALKSSCLCVECDQPPVKREIKTVECKKGLDLDCCQCEPNRGTSGTTYIQECNPPQETRYEKCKITTEPYLEKEISGGHTSDTDTCDTDNQSKKSSKKNKKKKNKKKSKHSITTVSASGSPITCDIEKKETTQLKECKNCCTTIKKEKTKIKRTELKPEVCKTVSTTETCCCSQQESFQEKCIEPSTPSPCIKKTKVECYEPPPPQICYPEPEICYPEPEICYEPQPQPQPPLQKCYPCVRKTIVVDCPQKCYEPQRICRRRIEVQAECYEPPKPKEKVVQECIVEPKECIPPQKQKSVEVCTSTSTFQQPKIIEPRINRTLKQSDGCNQFPETIYCSKGVLKRDNSYEVENSNIPKRLKEDGYDERDLQLPGRPFFESGNPGFRKSLKEICFKGRSNKPRSPPADHGKGCQCPRCLHCREEINWAESERRKREILDNYYLEKDYRTRDARSQRYQNRLSSRRGYLRDEDDSCDSFVEKDCTCPRRKPSRKFDEDSNDIYVDCPDTSKCSVWNFKKSCPSIENQNEIYKRGLLKDRICDEDSILYDDECYDRRPRVIQTKIMKQKKSQTSRTSLSNFSKPNSSGVTFQNSQLPTKYSPNTKFVPCQDEDTSICTNDIDLICRAKNQFRSRSFPREASVLGTFIEPIETTLSTKSKSCSPVRLRSGFCALDSYNQEPCCKDCCFKNSFLSSCSLSPGCPNMVSSENSIENSCPFAYVTKNFNNNRSRHKCRSKHAIRLQSGASKKNEGRRKNCSDDFCQGKLVNHQKPNLQNARKTSTSQRKPAVETRKSQERRRSSQVRRGSYKSKPLTKTRESRDSTLSRSTVKSQESHRSINSRGSIKSRESKISRDGRSQEGRPSRDRRKSRERPSKEVKASKEYRKSGDYQQFTESKRSRGSIHSRKSTDSIRFVEDRRSRDSLRSREGKRSRDSIRETIRSREGKKSRDSLRSGECRNSKECRKSRDSIGSLKVKRSQASIDQRSFKRVSSKKSNASLQSTGSTRSEKKDPPKEPSVSSKSPTNYTIDTLAQNRGQVRPTRSPTSKKSMSSLTDKIKAILKNHSLASKRSRSRACSINCHSPVGRCEPRCPSGGNRKKWNNDSENVEEKYVKPNTAQPAARRSHLERKNSLDLCASGAIVCPSLEIFLKELREREKLKSCECDDKKQREDRDSVFSRRYNEPENISFLKDRPSLVVDLNTGQGQMQFRTEVPRSSLKNTSKSPERKSIRLDEPKEKPDQLCEDIGCKFSINSPKICFCYKTNSQLEMDPNFKKNRPRSQQERRLTQEQRASLETRPISERLSSSENKRQVSEWRSTSVCRQTSERCPSSGNCLESSERRLTSERIPSLANRQSSDRQPSSERRSSERQPTSERIPSVTNRKSSERQPSSERRSSERQPTSERIPSVTNRKSSERQPTSERAPSLANRKSSERRPTSERIPSLAERRCPEGCETSERQPSSERRSSERQPSAERKSSERRVTSERISIVENQQLQQPAERRSTSRSISERKSPSRSISNSKTLGNSEEIEELEVAIDLEGKKSNCGCRRRYSGRDVIEALRPMSQEKHRPCGSTGRRPSSRCSNKEKDCIIPIEPGTTLEVTQKISKGGSSQPCPYRCIAGSSSRKSVESKSNSKNPLELGNRNSALLESMVVELPKLSSSRGTVKRDSSQIRQSRITYSENVTKYELSAESSIQEEPIEKAVRRDKPCLRPASQVSQGEVSEASLRRATLDPVNTSSRRPSNSRERNFESLINLLNPDTKIKKKVPKKPTSTSKDKDLDSLLNLKLNDDEDDDSKSFDNIPPFSSKCRNCPHEKKSAEVPRKRSTKRLSEFVDENIIGRTLHPEEIEARRKRSAQKKPRATYSKKIEDILFYDQDTEGQLENIFQSREHKYQPEESDRNGIGVNISGDSTPTTPSESGRFSPTDKKLYYYEGPGKISVRISKSIFPSEEETLGIVDGQKSPTILDRARAATGIPVHKIYEKSSLKSPSHLDDDDSTKVLSSSLSEHSFILTRTSKQGLGKSSDGSTRADFQKSNPASYKEFMESIDSYLYNKLQKQKSEEKQCARPRSSSLNRLQSNPSSSKSKKSLGEYSQVESCSSYPKGSRILKCEGKKSHCRKPGKVVNKCSGPRNFKEINKYVSKISTELANRKLQMSTTFQANPTPSKSRSKTKNKLAAGGINPHCYKEHCGRSRSRSRVRDPKRTLSSSSGVACPVKKCSTKNLKDSTCSPWNTAQFIWDSAQHHEKIAGKRRGVSKRNISTSTSKKISSHRRRVCPEKVSTCMEPSVCGTPVNCRESSICDDYSLPSFKESICGVPSPCKMLSPSPCSRSRSTFRSCKSPRTPCRVNSSCQTTVYRCDAPGVCVVHSPCSSTVVKIPSVCKKSTSSCRSASPCRVPTVCKPSRSCGKVNICPEPSICKSFSTCESQSLCPTVGSLCTKLSSCSTPCDPPTPVCRPRSCSPKPCITKPCDYTISKPCKTKPVSCDYRPYDVISKPCDSKPCSPRPCDYRPCDSKPTSKPRFCEFRPCDSKPCDSKLCDYKPCDPKPCDYSPCDPRPCDYSCDPRPCDYRPCDSKPCDPKPCDYSPCDLRPCNFSPCDPRPCDYRPCDSKPCDYRPCDPRPCSPRPCTPSPCGTKCSHTCCSEIRPCCGPPCCPFGKKCSSFSVKDAFKKINCRKASRFSYCADQAIVKCCGKPCCGSNTPQKNVVYPKWSEPEPGPGLREYKNRIETMACPDVCDPDSYSERLQDLVNRKRKEIDRLKCKLSKCSKATRK